MKDNSDNQIFEKAPLRDRMTVYVGVFVVLLVSWFYILGMGWHMNTLPFVENKMMNMPMEKSMGFLEMSTLFSIIKFRSNGKNPNPEYLPFLVCNNKFLKSNLFSL